MSLLKAMEVFAADWDDVQRRLEPGQLRSLVDLVARFVAEDDPGASSNTAEDIMDLLLEGLPVNHPVLQALAGPQDRFLDQSGPAADLAWRQLAEPLRARLEALAPGSTPEGGPPGTTIGDDTDDD